MLVTRGRQIVLHSSVGFKHETEFSVWRQVIIAVQSIRKTWAYSDVNIRHALESFFRELISTKAHDLGWEINEDESHAIHQLREIMLEGAGLSGDEEAISASQDLFKRSLGSSLDVIHPAIRGAVYKVILENSGSEEYVSFSNITRQH